MKKSSHFKYIGIDPGKSGGITVIHGKDVKAYKCCLLYTSPSPRDGLLSRMPSSA